MGFWLGGGGGIGLLGEVVVSMKMLGWTEVMTSVRSVFSASDEREELWPNIVKFKFQTTLCIPS